MEILEYIGELKSLSDLLTANGGYNPHVLMDKLAETAVIKARVNAILPEVQYLYDSELAAVTEKIINKFEDNLQGNSAYIKNYIQGEMKEYKRAMNYCDRISSTIERQSENYRSILSALKQEFANV